MIVAIGGRVGSGKTTVAAMLQEEFPKARLIEADEVGHAVLRFEEVKRQLTRAFGEGILKDGEISRPALAQIAFASDEARTKLNAITHPRLKSHLRQLLKKEPGLTIVAAALVEELDLRSAADLVVEVWAPTEAILERNRGRFPMLKERLQAQSRLDEQDMVIDNSGSLKETRAAVSRLADRIRNAGAPG